MLERTGRMPVLLSDFVTIEYPIAFPLNLGHLAWCNISLKRAKVPDGGLPPFQRNFVVARRQRNPKPALVVRDKRGHLAILAFPPQKWHLPAAWKPAASALIGPGLAGLIVITPSIPDSPAEGVCPVEAQTAMTMSAKAMSKLRNLTAHYIRAAL